MAAYRMRTIFRQAFCFMAGLAVTTLAATFRLQAQAVTAPLRQGAVLLQGTQAASASSRMVLSQTTTPPAAAAPAATPSHCGLTGQVGYGDHFNVSGDSLGMGLQGAGEVTCFPNDGNTGVVVKGNATQINNPNIEAKAALYGAAGVRKRWLGGDVTVTGGVTYNLGSPAAGRTLPDVTVVLRQGVVKLAVQQDTVPSTTLAGSVTIPVTKQAAIGVTGSQQISEARNGNNKTAFRPFAKIYLDGQQRFEIKGGYFWNRNSTVGIPNDQGFYVLGTMQL